MTNLKKYIFILNQLCEIEKKANKLKEKNSIYRNVDKLKDFFENEFSEDISFMIENPLHQKFDETRTDLEAMIAGESADDLVVVDVIKPIIRIKQNNRIQIIQRGVVVVENINLSKNDDKKKSQNSYHLSKEIGKEQKKSSKQSNKKSWKLKPRILKKKNKRGK